MSWSWQQISKSWPQQGSWWPSGDQPLTSWQALDGSTVVRRRMALDACLLFRRLTDSVLGDLAVDVAVAEGKFLRSKERQARKEGQKEQDKKLFLVLKAFVLVAKSIL